MQSPPSLAWHVPAYAESSRLIHAVSRRCERLPAGWLMLAGTSPRSESAFHNIVNEFLHLPDQRDSGERRSAGGCVRLFLNQTSNMAGVL